MGHMASEERDLLIDLESGGVTSEKGTNQSPALGNTRVKNLLNRVSSGLLFYNRSVGAECRVNSYSNLGEPSEVVISKNSEGEESGEHMALVEKNHSKEKHKKAPKPPRPPKGPLLDAADRKLIREISALAMEKRARSERLKALRKRKEAKSCSVPSSSSSSSSSNNSLFALVISVIFFLVILFQGLAKSGSLGVSFPGSPEPAVTANSLISVQLYNNRSADDCSGCSSESHNSTEQAFGSKSQSV